jgi:hypothetical protein
MLGTALEPFGTNERREQINKQEQRDRCRQIDHVPISSSDFLARADEGVTRGHGYQPK